MTDSPLHLFDDDAWQCVISSRGQLPKIWFVFPRTRTRYLLKVLQCAVGRAASNTIAAGHSACHTLKAACLVCIEELFLL